MFLKYLELNLMLLMSWVFHFKGSNARMNVPSVFCHQGRTRIGLSWVVSAAPAQGQPHEVCFCLLWVSHGFVWLWLHSSSSSKRTGDDTRDKNLLPLSPALWVAACLLETHQTFWQWHTLILYCFCNKLCMCVLCFGYSTHGPSLSLFLLVCL